MASRLPASDRIEKGFSAHQLRGTLNVDYKTACFIEHRIRECMDEDDSGPVGGAGKTVEADKTYVMKQRGGPSGSLKTSADR